METTAVEAVMLGIAENDPTVEFFGKVGGAMQDAVATILVAAGYAVDKDVKEYAPSDLMVLGREPQESWRSWLSEQMDHLQARAQSRRQG